MAIDSSKCCEITHFLSFDSPVLDVRNLPDYIRSHFKGSGHIPASDLENRQFELPKSATPLRLVACERTYELAFKILQQKNYPIEAVIVWEEDTNFEDASASIESGASKAQLWRANSGLMEFLNKINCGKYSLNSEQPNVLDIGCGSGRDLVYLASHGWLCTGIDYLPQMLDKYQFLAKEHQVNVRSVLMDLESNLDGFIEFEEDFDLVQVFRYLHRPLLPFIKDKIKSGGYLIYQTFVEGCEKFGKPRKPRFILKHGELASVFSDFEILEDEVVYLEDGRPTNWFVARKS